MSEFADRLKYSIPIRVRLPSPFGYPSSSSDGQVQCEFDRLTVQSPELNAHAQRGDLNPLLNRLLRMISTVCRSADFAQGFHELIDDSGIGSVFLPDNPKWYVYTFRRNQIFENNLSGRKLFYRLADQAIVEMHARQSACLYKPLAA